MRQRVGLARALASMDETPGRGLLLLDEPFSAVDAVTRDGLQAELLRVWEVTGATMLFVTHDVHEAVRLGQRVVLLSAEPGAVVAQWRVVDWDPRMLVDEIVVRLQGATDHHGPT